MEDLMDKNLIEILGKVIIAAAWVDKKIDPEEINSLKDLLFQFQRTIMMSDIHLGQEILAFVGGISIDKNYDAGIGFPAKVMARFEMYLESPVEAAERESLVRQLCEAIWTEEDKVLVIAALKDMVEADGAITDEEQILLDDVKALLENESTGIFNTLRRLVHDALRRRSKTLSSAPNREKYFEDFLRNKVYYEMRRQMDLDATQLDIPDEYLRKLGTIGGMMARVAQVDNIVLDKELEKITSIIETGWGVMSILQTDWGLSSESADFVINIAVAEVSKSFDYLRMSRDFFDITTPKERNNLVELLFAVANADGTISNAEFKEIRTIADYLVLSRSRVDETYLKIISDF
jgi:uncharacterized tellurite resistance protein B-like protein